MRVKIKYRPFDKYRLKRLRYGFWGMFEINYYKNGKLSHTKWFYKFRYKRITLYVSSEEELVNISKQYKNDSRGVVIVKKTQIGNYNLHDSYDCDLTLISKRVYDINSNKIYFQMYRPEYQDSIIKKMYYSIERSDRDDNMLYEFHYDDNGEIGTIVEFVNDTEEAYPAEGDYVKNFDWNKYSYYKKSTPMIPEE